MKTPARTPARRRTAVRATRLLIVASIAAVAIFAVSAQASPGHVGRTLATDPGPIPADPVAADPGAAVAGTGSITISARRSAPQGGVSPQVAGYIHCNVTIDNPHNSGHNPGNVNVVSHVTCDNIVSSIAITTRLFRSGIQVASTPAYRADFNFLNGNAAVSCLNASYGGVADVTVVFPPGYTPASGSTTVGTPVVPITC